MKKNKKIKEKLIIKLGMKCQICNKKFSAHDLCIEHVIPRAKGGTNKFENLSLSCRSCNSQKFIYSTSNFPIASFFKRPLFYIKLEQYENKNSVFSKKEALENLEKIENELKEKIAILKNVKEKIKEI